MSYELKLRDIRWEEFYNSISKSKFTARDMSYSGLSETLKKSIGLDKQ